MLGSLISLTLTSVMLQQFRGGWKKQSKPETWKARSCWFKIWKKTPNSKLAGLWLDWQLL